MACNWTHIVLTTQSYCRNVTSWPEVTGIAGKVSFFIEWLCCFDKWSTGINRCNGWRTLNSSAEWGHSSVCPMFHTPIYLRFLQNPRLQDCQSSCNCHTSSIVLFLLQHPDYNTSCLDISFKDKDKAMSMNLQTISKLWLHPYSPFSGYFMLFCVWKKDGYDLFHSYRPVHQNFGFCFLEVESTAGTGDL